MKFELSNENSQTNLKLVDEIVASDKGEFSDLINQVVEPGNPIIIDFSKLDFMDSAGLGFLLNLWQQTNEKGMEVKVTGASGEVKELLELSDFHILFKFE